MSGLSPSDIQAHLDQLTKPPGSLGRLEDLAARLCTVQDTLRPVTKPRRLVVFAADHGVVADGVSAWPSDVTTLMIDNIAGGGAACCVLAKAQGVQLRLVDVGSSGPEREGTPMFRIARVAPGTASLAQGDAMDRAQWDAAWAHGVEEARYAARDGARVLIGGEMGIGNTTSAACLCMLLSDVSIADAVGRGAGADDETLARKRAIVAAAVERARARMTSEPIEALASVSGFEIVAMAGFFAEGARICATLLIDGVIATAAALIAEHVKPGTKKRMIASHLSVEPAHGQALAALGLEPFLDWNLRLGEGTGALLMLPLLDSAAAMVAEMATFESAGISTEPTEDAGSPAELEAS